MAIKTNKKNTSAKTVSKKDSSYFSFRLIPEKFQTPVLLSAILILILIFFRTGLFEGKVFSSADNIAANSFKTFIDDANAKGEFPLWVPYIFCGMPSYGSLIAHPERMYDYSHAVYVIIRNAVYAIGSNSSIWQIVFFYIILAFGFYFLGNYKFKDRLIGFYCAIAVVFITPIIQYIIIGHNTKMIAIMMFPWVFLFTERIYDILANKDGKINLFRLGLNFAALVFFIHIQMSSNHIQMLFYFYFMLGLYLLYRIIYSLIKKLDSASSIKITVVFLIAIGFSAAMNADSYLSIKEYSKYSIRGVPPLSNQLPENKNNTKNSEPLDYEYATNWSFSPGEVMTLFIPYWQGFGDVDYKGQRVNTYWGQMPFTTSPVYFGVLTMFLAFIGIYYNFRRNPLVQALSIVSFLALIISFGRNAPILFDLMFYHFPFFSSFRAPVMIHIIINVSIVILAGFGIKSVIDTAKDNAASARFTSISKYIIPILALPIIFSVLGFKGYYDSMVASSPFVQKLQAQGANAQQIQQYISQLSQIAYDNVKSEMLIVGALLVICYLICMYFIKGNIKYQFFVPAIVLLVIFDLWHIGNKTLHYDNKSDQEAIFKTPDYVDYILKMEKDLNSFRVLELNKGVPPTSNTLAYWRLNGAFGYQGAKIRIFQDMVDLAGITSPSVMNLMNIKYLISDQPFQDSTFNVTFKGSNKDSKYVIENKEALPRAFFVSSYKVSDALTIMNELKNGTFDVRKEVRFEKEPNIKLDAVDSTAKVKVTGYENQNITLDAEANGNNLLFISEVYYPAGWKAYIDGNETEIYKTNYLFRSIVVPKGKHKVEFKFAPSSYTTGKTISMGANVLLILIFGASLGGIFLRRKKPGIEMITDK